MNKYIERLQMIKENRDGFSLIELVVAVGILAILSVVGVVAYSKITENARVAAVEAAAADVLTGATAYDGNGQDFNQAAKEWMDSSNGSIEVSATKEGDGICVKAEMIEHNIIANKGAGCETEGVITPGNGGSNSEAPNGDHIKIETVFDRGDLAGIDIEVSLYGNDTKLDTVNTRLNEGDALTFYDEQALDWGSQYDTYTIEIVSPGGTQRYTVETIDFSPNDLDNGSVQWTYVPGAIVLGDNVDGITPPVEEPEKEEYVINMELDVYLPEYSDQYVEATVKSGPFGTQMGGGRLNSEGKGTITIPMTTTYSLVGTSFENDLSFDIILEEMYDMKVVSSRTVNTTLGELTKTGENSWSARYTMN